MLNLATLERLLVGFEGLTIPRLIMMAVGGVLI